MESQQQPMEAVSVPANGGGEEELIGYVDVHVRSARDIQNICIYHKQDVYTRLSLPGQGAPAVSTQVVNGGGRNPVFDQSVRVGVRARDVDAPLRCEVWMLSRVKNYLQDQLLGFALVPLPDVVAAEGGTLAAEFPLSTNDLFHSPAGFLQLELSYIGVVPEVIPVSPTPKPAALADEDAAADGGKEYENMEFPDLNLVEENQIMLSEYVGLPCTAVEPQSSESLLTSEDVDGAATESHDAAGVRVVRSFSTDNSTADDSVGAGAYRSDTPVSSVSTTDQSPAAAVPATPQSNPSEPSGNHALSSAAGQKEEKASEAADAAEVDSSHTVQVNSPCTAVSESAVDKPAPAPIGFKLEQEVQVNQKEIMDMYMKSMQQFTESLAKMKLPLDMDNGSSDKSGSAASPADSSGTDSSTAAAKKPTAGAPQDKSPKVFYGSRAFF
ncbi:uncharacterized protein LOC100836313 [Brachypodium distachyon]|uniref:C2 domain-containing protein n=1 Tax=Brachypodium distachyon TaxID=15368 RepID=A0A0Q3GWU5_BRADI|nr:uncharacterized protein LOC100836313 [Brachypodium distachyon]XP_010236289.1 uncharacterized protein LOC100836313 [Brachypodium distachyon]KQK15495.1 hypothetical protein BRADI_1g23257v3 [Brachypodium distachyon]PNT74859.1 hypothetical protein BRADI_1g23257v3 [Brachypodium distachyon]|eukprot:XP_003562809.1 uncharacterized protein LOC100836313 [Brachypodium distachyon]